MYPWRNCGDSPDVCMELVICTFIQRSVVWQQLRKIWVDKRSTFVYDFPLLWTAFIFEHGHAL